MLRGISNFCKMANKIPSMKLPSGADMPIVGLGTWKVSRHLLFKLASPKTLQLLQQQLLSLTPTHPHFGYIIDLGDGWQVTSCRRAFALKYPFMRGNNGHCQVFANYLGSSLWFMFMCWLEMSFSWIYFCWHSNVSFLPLYLNIFALKLANIKSRKLVSSEVHEINNWNLRMHIATNYHVILIKPMETR